MEELTVPLLYEVSGLIPVVFDDIVENVLLGKTLEISKNP